MNAEAVTERERLALRERPKGLPIGQMNWGKLLFMHWPLKPEALRPLIPERLTIDTFEGAAWVGVVPFTMWGVRPTFTPPLPGLSRFHELNVRTYVHLDGVPGVWFHSLDAASPLAVRGARAFFHLPYFNARMSLEQESERIIYSSERTHRDAPPARFQATWNIGDALPTSAPGSLEFFLTERYCLYAARGEKIYRLRIFHPPWPLRRAELSSYDSTMLAAHGLSEPDDAPLLHYAEALRVQAWPLFKVKAN
ncbi:MAG: uncharacterized protein QOF02_2661 [Blastocatellia bacterium]|jgi:uncharacterized protein YqjF (DUF2071 family)|nr:uncharacterized protein [Blastocatellia bacterium]